LQFSLKLILLFIVDAKVQLHSLCCTCKFMLPSLVDVNVDIADLTMFWVRVSISWDWIFI